MATDIHSKIYQGLLRLDKAPNAFKTLFWLLCLSGASAFAIKHSVGIFYIRLGKFFLLDTYNWISILSPTFTAVAVSRLAGLKWKYSLLHFIFLPILVFIAHLLMIFFALLATGGA